MKQIKNSALSIPHVSRLMYSILLALCLTYAIATGAYAQVAYNFQAPDDIHAVTGAGQNILTMDCLAANGYGQWTSSSSSTNATSNPACFLLSNKLNKFNGTSITDDAQAGVLAAKQFNSSGDAYPNEAIKCVANLKGNVRYVWMDNSSGRTKFFVEGFDPATTTNASTGIGIDFVGLPTSSSQKIVKDGAAILYGEVTLPGSGTLVTTTNEALYPDMFDIAIDASYLYIVWEQHSGGGYTIKAEAVNLTGTFSSTPLGLVGTGQRPTVAVDVRHSGSVANIDVVYLNTVPGQVEWTKYNGTSFPVATPVPAMTGLGWAWSNATHARIVDASAAGSGSTDKAIYFIAKDVGINKCLFFNRITAGTLATTCDYCDGTLNMTRPSNCPIETTSGFPVVDDYIRAFADPYEGSTTSGSFDEFHCLYILNHTGGTINGGSKGGNYALMIIPISDASKGFCVSGGSSAGDFPDYDPDANTTNNPFLYVGAVNQMGIHPHWLADSSGTQLHYYRRDSRTFTQNIEENTLITGACEISANATLTNKWLTLYADPSTAGATGYVGGGSLTIDNHVTLAINPTGGLGVFVQLGASTVNFVSLPGGILEVDADDTMDYYGNAHAGFTGVGEFKFTGSDDYMVSNDNGSWPYDIYHPAILNLHGGTALQVGLTGASYFTCYDAKIHLNYETNVLGVGGNEEGELYIHDHSSFTKCWIYSDDNNAADDKIAIDIATNGDVGTPGTGDADYTDLIHSYATDTFEQCGFNAGGGAGHATMEITGDLMAPNSVIIDNGLVSDWSIKGGHYLYWPIIVTNVTFYDIIEDALDISFAPQPPLAPTNYKLLVDRCVFLYYSDFTNFPNPDGIKVESAPDLITGSPTLAQDGLRESISITNNTFEGRNGESAGSVEAAIHFSDCTGDIGYDTIHGTKYQRGIWNESSVGSSPDETWSLICSNTIYGLSHASAAGLSTDYYKGYAKLNSITGCTIGHASGAFDVGHVIFSSYTGSSVAGYEGYSNSETDMTGVHFSSDGTPNANDYAANNTLKSNGNEQILLVDGALVFLGQAWSLLSPPSWSVYGENNFEQGTSSSVTLLSGTTASIGNVDKNWWGSTSIDPGWDPTSGHWDHSNTSNVVAFEVPVTAPATGNTAASETSFSGVSCSDGLITYEKGNQPLSMPDTDIASVCYSLFAAGWGDLNNGQCEASYDTLKLFMEHCYWEPQSWNQFSYIGAAISGWTDGGAGRWPDYLSWLKSVLYLNMDTNWYCDDVGQMFTALQATPDNFNNLAVREAVANYIVSNHRCPNLQNAIATMGNAASHWRHEYWLDSIVFRFDTMQPYGVYSWWVDSLVNLDTLENPYDSTIPSLWQDSLEILLGPQYANAVQPSSPITSQALLNATLLDNPMQDEIDVSFEMGRTALITMELRDILGRAVPLTYAKYQLEPPGTHSARIPAPNLPPGTYYLRITTDTGEVITLKVVKQ